MLNQMEKIQIIKIQIEQKKSHISRGVDKALIEKGPNKTQRSNI